jgi:undecaprenyl-diphosphatase
VLFGVILFIHAAIFVSLPRIYSGLHFPADILIGGLIGISVTLLLFSGFSNLARPVVSLAERRGYVVYPILFFTTFQTASMFDSSRDLIKFLYSIAKTSAA